MEEGMGTTTINDYLTYVPVGVVRHSVYSSGTRTTHPAHPRDLVGVDIVSWETSAESVQRECERASAQQSDEKLEPLLEKNRAVSFVQNEAGLERALDNRLFMPLQRLLCKKCGKDIDPEQFLEHFQEIKSMFEEIHRKGVAHGDISLRNIVIDDTTGKGRDNCLSIYDKVENFHLQCGASAVSIM
ncbi:unnamed protein product [Calypogeia fissa]